MWLIVGAQIDFSWLCLKFERWVTLKMVANDPALDERPHKRWGDEIAIMRRGRKPLVMTNSDQLSSHRVELIDDSVGLDSGYLSVTALVFPPGLFP